MDYEIVLKQNLHRDEILYVLKYSDIKNYSFIFTEEQTQETLNNLVEQEVNKEIEYTNQQKEIEEKQAEAIEILGE